VVTLQVVEFPFSSSHYLSLSILSEVILTKRIIRNMNNLFYLKITFSELKRRKHEECLSERDYNVALRILQKEYEMTKERELKEEFQSYLEGALKDFNIEVLNKD